LDAGHTSKLTAEGNAQSSRAGFAGYRVDQANRLASRAVNRSLNRRRKASLAFDAMRVLRRLSIGSAGDLDRSSQMKWHGESLGSIPSRDTSEAAIGAHNRNEKK
jgi:hypothetical protein